MQNFEKDASGRYKYLGNWQFFRGNAAAETKTVIILMVMMALGIIGVGCVPGASIRKWYILGPYAFSFLFAGVTVFYCICILLSHWIMMEHEHKSAMFGVKLCSGLASLVMFLTFAGQVVNIVANKPEFLLANIVIAALALMGFIGAWILFGRSRKEWH